MRALRGTRPSALAAATLLLLSACSSEPDTMVSDESTSPSSEPSAPSSSPSGSPDDATLTFRGRNVVGDWETGPLLGDTLPTGRAYGRPQVLYAVTDAMSKEGEALVSLGLVEGDRIFRIIPALDPEAEEAPDGIDLYGGDRVDRGDGADPSYQLVGAIPGKVHVSITGPDGRSRPVTVYSHRVLPGFTVFHDSGQWQPDWDALQLAPLVVSTDDGTEVEVRERSWVG